MKNGEMVELTENTTFHKKGKKATFLKTEPHNEHNAEVVWIGEECAYQKFGDTEVIPKKLLKRASN